MGRVENHKIFSQVANIEEQIGQLYKEIGGLKTKIIELIEENKNLHIENEHIRQRLEVDTQTVKSTVDSEKEKSIVIGEGYDNLARLYQEGFHICNIKYGSLRTDGDCLFCLSFLNK